MKEADLVTAPLCSGFSSATASSGTQLSTLGNESNALGCQEQSNLTSYRFHQLRSFAALTDQTRFLQDQLLSLCVSLL